MATHILNNRSTDKFNLKGVLIGNGLTDFDTDVERNKVEFWFWHGMTPTKTFNWFEQYLLNKPGKLYPEKNSSKENNEYLWYL